jgi:hypothetical protein
VEKGRPVVIADGVVNFQGLAEAPAWLDDADEMRRQADKAAAWFDNHPGYSDAVVGVYSDAYRVVHCLGSVTYFNSDCRYRGAGADYAGDVVGLGYARNIADGQGGVIRGRILGAEIETPAEYRYYLIFRHTYCVLVD